MNIVIYTPDFSWAGGTDFLHGLVKGLLTQNKKNCNISILIYDPSIKEQISFYRRIASKLKLSLRLLRRPNKIRKILLAKSSFKSDETDYNHLQNIEEVFLNEKVELIRYNNKNYSDILKIFREINADVILPVLNNDFPNDFPIPWVGYLFDFIYRYHTHLYTKDFCLDTDIKYATTLKNAKSVIVNSNSVAEDLNNFFPYAKSRVYNLPFAPFTNKEVYEAAVAKNSVAEQYNIRGRYFIISNQFWLHKSHETAFEALSLLKKLEDYEDVCIICTGRTTDLSGTDQRKLALLDFISNLGLQNNVHLLGHIPKVDQLALMIRSVAVIQPTLFEGGPGGGSVYMAVANGVPAIISDIAVNKEIVDEPLITFFTTLNQEDLMQKMKSKLLDDRKILNYSSLEVRNEKKLKMAGEKILECIEFAIGHPFLKN